MSLDFDSKRAQAGEITGDDHYARFYRRLKEDVGIDPGKYEAALRDLSTVYPLQEDMNVVFDELATYIEDELRRRTGRGDIRVYIRHSSDYKNHELIVTLPFRVGGETKSLVLYDNDMFARWTRIAGSRGEFNSLIESVIAKVEGDLKALRETLTEDDKKLVLINVYTPNREPYPILVRAPKTLTEEELAQAVRSIVEDLSKRGGAWSDAEVLEELERRLGIEILEDYEEYNIEIPPV